MNVRAADLPSSRSLALGLRAAMKRAAAGDSEDFEVVSRHMSRMSSSFPAEIVTCRLPSLGLIRLLIKYGVGHEASGYGHRGGVAYEGEVYERVLAHARSSTVTFWGRQQQSQGAFAWLLLEYLESATRINTSRRPFDAMVGAARWIGGFHAETTALHQSAVLDFLNAYDQEYFAGWARRTAQFAGLWAVELPWLPRACAGFAEAAATLLDEASKVIVHGEYYPKNILTMDDSIYPVDWESAAIGARRDRPRQPHGPLAAGSRPGLRA